MCTGTFEKSSYTIPHINHCFQGFLIRDVQGTLLWLNSWPAGLKLNTELSALYCHSLSSVLIAWNCESPANPGLQCT
jgi:hypothetical protein